jgi:hypothetical protein
MPRSNPPALVPVIDPTARSGDVVPVLARLLRRLRDRQTLAEPAKSDGKECKSGKPAARRPR